MFHTPDAKKAAHRLLKSLTYKELSMELLIKLINSAGLFLDIVGAWLVYIYVFNKPELLVEQSPIPSSSKTEIINGIETTTVNMGVSLDLRAVQVNTFNKYKDKLFIKRARLGFYFLILGFLLQIISNFGSFLNEIAVYSVITVATLFVLSGALYLFVYLSNIMDIPNGAGDKFTVEKVQSEKGEGIEINSDSDFQKWSSEVSKYSKRMGLTS